MVLLVTGKRRRASALRLGAYLGAFVSYDERQLEAARALGLPVVSPR